VQAARVEYAAAQRQQVEAEARHAALEAASAEAVAERDLAFKQVHPHGGVSLCRTWSTTRSTSSSSSGSSASRTA
jgi:hypothetical protein